MAFDLQSQHITGLLVELQEKESALLRQGGELQCCMQELALLAAPGEERASTVVTVDPGADRSSELHAAASPSSVDGHAAAPGLRLDSQAEAPSLRAIVHTADTLPPAHPPLILSEQGEGSEGEDGTGAQTPSVRPQTMPVSGRSVEEEKPTAPDARGPDSHPSTETEPCKAASRSPEEEQEPRSGGAALPPGGSSEGLQDVRLSRDEGVNRGDTGEEKQQESVVQVNHWEHQVGLHLLCILLFIIGL